MATVTTEPTIETRLAQHEDDARWESALFSVADTYEVSGFVHRNKHWEAGVIFCNSSGVQVAATAGTVAVDIKPWATMFYEAPGATPSVDATAPTLITWEGVTYGARFVPAGVLTATHYKVRFAVAGS